MNKCPACGHQRQGEEKKCPQCDIFYSQIDEFLAQEEEQEERDWFRTRYKRVLAAPNRKQAFKDELRSYCATLPRGSTFILYVVIAFVFALVVVVI